MNKKYDMCFALAPKFAIGELVKIKDDMVTKLFPQFEGMVMDIDYCRDGRQLLTIEDSETLERHVMECGWFESARPEYI